MLILSHTPSGSLYDTAIQIYGELRHVTGGNRNLLREIVYDGAQPWNAEKQAGFVANFPDKDIECTRAAYGI